MTTQIRTSGVDVSPLGLSTVLVGSLPAALMSEDAPERYTVEAVFTRRPAKEEVAEILSSTARDALTTAGYSTVELGVSDRRLTIANTNLEELRDGLGSVLADLLAATSRTIRSRQEAAALELEEATVSAHVRAAEVARLAESVTFHPSTHVR